MMHLIHLLCVPVLKLALEYMCLWVLYVCVCLCVCVWLFLCISLCVYLGESGYKSKNGSILLAMQTCLKSAHWNTFSLVLFIIYFFFENSISRIPWLCANIYICEIVLLKSLVKFWSKISKNCYDIRRMTVRYIEWFRGWCVLNKKILKMSFV